MKITIAYLDQASIDLAEKLLGRKLTWREKDKMYQRVVTFSGERAADRLVEGFRLSGHIAFIESTEE